MSSEIIRGFVVATACTGVIVFLGFLPFAFGDGVSQWSASRVTDEGMPVGQSSPSTVMPPLRLNEPRFSTPTDLFNK